MEKTNKFLSNAEKKRIYKEIEKQIALGEKSYDACKSFGIRNTTFYNWRKKFGKSEEEETAPKKTKHRIMHIPLEGRADSSYVAIMLVRPENLAKVLGDLWK